MDTPLFGFLMIVFGIFNLCLLVKIWKATNDVKNIRRILENKYGAVEKTNEATAAPNATVAR